MRYMLILSMLLLTPSCVKQVLHDTPMGYSFMPAYLNIDSIRPIVFDDTNKVVDSTMSDFVSMAIDSGVLTTREGKLTLPPGVLISDRKAALYSFYRSSWERQKKEFFYTKYLMKEYYDKAKSAEVLYQNEIIRWKTEAQRSWIEKNMAYFGFGAGIVTMILVDYALH